VRLAAQRLTRLEQQLEAALALADNQAVRIDALEDKCMRLAEENEDLRRKLAENSSNSSKPPSSDSPRDRAGRRGPTPTGKSRGAQPGHKANKRELVPANKVHSITNCFAETCRGCARGLPKRRDPNPLRHQVWDLPKIEPIVDEYRLHRTSCDVCGKTTCAEPPRGVPRGTFGPGVLGLIAMLVADGHMSRRKVVGLLRDAFGLNISLGALSEAEWIVSEATTSAVEEAHARALTESPKHVDATSWFQAGWLKALWVMATKSVTVFTIAANATQELLKRWISSTRGVLVTDRGRQFQFWAMERRQICWAHLIRKFVDFSEHGGRAGGIGRALHDWSRILMHTYHRVRDGTLPRSELQRKAVNIRAHMERLLSRGTRPSAAGIRGACRDILEHRNAMWLFVDDPSVEPTNNHAERELRGLVIWRKSSFGTCSERGNVFAARLKTVIHTCRKQQRNVLEFLRNTVDAALRRIPTPSLLRHSA
jgi:transposase